MILLRDIERPQSDGGIPGHILISFTMSLRLLLTMRSDYLSISIDSLLLEHGVRDTRQAGTITNFKMDCVLGIISFTSFHTVYLQTNVSLLRYDHD